MASKENLSKIKIKTAPKNVHMLTTFVEHDIIKNRKHVLHVSIELYKRVCGSLGEREMLWEHELQASVSTAFSRSPKLPRVFLFNK